MRSFLSLTRPRSSVCVSFTHPPGVCPPGMGPTAEATFGEGGAMDCDGVAQAWGDDFLGRV